MIVSFHKKGWEHFQYWLQTDKRMARKILQLIADVQRHPYEGLGKPEPLRHDYAGFWSRRIDEEHRLVYEVKQNEIIIAQCRFHYKD